MSFTLAQGPPPEVHEDLRPSNYLSSTVNTKIEGLPGPNRPTESNPDALNMMHTVPPLSLLLNFLTQLLDQIA